MIPDIDLPFDDEGAGSESPPIPNKDRRASVEDAEDEDEDEDFSNPRSRFSVPYPDPAGIPTSSERKPTAFERYHEATNKPYGPFDDEDDWELGKFLMENLGQTKTDEFLQLGKVRFIVVV